MQGRGTADRAGSDMLPAMIADIATRATTHLDVLLADAAATA